MASGLYSLVSEDRLRDVLQTFYEFTGIAVQLLDEEGAALMTFGSMPNYCRLAKKNVFRHNECALLHQKAGERAQEIGEGYMFSCHANLNHIAFPLINREQLLGSILIGPFLLDEPDSTLISGLADKYHLTPNLSLEMYDELSSIQVVPPARANLLKKMVDHLLSPLIPSERVILLQAQERAHQQAEINETIQAYKEQKAQPSLLYFHQKERELLAKVRVGNVREVKGLLNELMGYVLFTQGGQMELIRPRAIELTTLLSRVALDGGADVDSVYDLNGKFLSLMYQERDLEELCMLLQDVAEGFMNAMFYDKDKGNAYIRKALRFIADNYYEHLELGAVADYVQLSPSYFSTLFRQVVGVNFREHLCRVRVEESKRLLLTTEYSLGDIAISIGFPDQSYYCKVFKRIVGMSPGKFRTAPNTTEK